MRTKKHLWQIRLFVTYRRDYVRLKWVKGNIVNSYDAQIWEFIRAGRRDALSTLFNKYYIPLLNYGLKLTSPKAFIKDCIQEVFMQLWISRSNLSKVQNVKSYLYTALRRKIIELNNSNRARKQRQKVYSTENSIPFLNVEELTIKDEFENIRKEKLKEAVYQLSKREKEAIYLKFFDGFSNDEIALIMEVNKQSVYNVISEALKKLEAYLEFSIR